MKNCEIAKPDQYHYNDKFQDPYLHVQNVIHCTAGTADRQSTTNLWHLPESVAGINRNSWTPPFLGSIHPNKKTNNCKVLIEADGAPRAGAWGSFLRKKWSSTSYSERFKVLCFLMRKTNILISLKRSDRNMLFQIIFSFSKKNILG